MPEKPKTQQMASLYRVFEIFHHGKPTQCKTFTFVRQNETLKDTVVKVLIYIKWNLLLYY